MKRVSKYALAEVAETFKHHIAFTKSGRNKVILSKDGRAWPFVNYIDAWNFLTEKPAAAEPTIQIESLPAYEPIPLLLEIEPEPYFNYATALDHMEKGRKVRRRNWTAVKYYYFMKNETWKNEAGETRVFIRTFYARTKNDKEMAVFPTPSDQIAKDWELAE